MPTSVAEWVPWVQAIAPLAQLAVIILGWLWIAHDNDKRERRKEVRALIVGLKAKLEALEDAASGYFTQDQSPAATALGLQIKRDLRRIGTDLTVIGSVCKGIDGDAAVIDIRQTITGRGEFDGAARVAIPPTHELLGEVGASINKLRVKLEDAFAKQYP